MQKNLFSGNTIETIKIYNSSTSSESKDGLMSVRLPHTAKNIAEAFAKSENLSSSAWVKDAIDLKVSTYAHRSLLEKLIPYLDKIQSNESLIFELINKLG